MHLNNKEIENNKLNEQIDILSDSSVNLIKEKEKMERKVYELSQIKNKNSNKMDKLQEDNEQLSKICVNQDLAIANLEKEKLELIMKNEDMKKEIKSLHIKLKTKDDKINSFKNQSNEGHKDVERLKVYYKT